MWLWNIFQIKYLQADGIFRKSNKVFLTSNEAKVDRIETSSMAANYYANSKADIMY